ncbi:MAG: hypothetical protein Q7O66_19260 [Dehalococcoidia bacterium]|nr:hypothetical protein [Dehalococcoidia bacterium]
MLPTEPKGFGRDVAVITVGHVVNQHVVAVMAAAPLADAVALLQATLVYQLVIHKGEPDQRRPNDMISFCDIVREIARRPRTIERRHTYASSGSPNRKVEG